MAMSAATSPATDLVAALDSEENQSVPVERVVRRATASRQMLLQRWPMDGMKARKGEQPMHGRPLPYYSDGGRWRTDEATPDAGLLMLRSCSNGESKAAFKEQPASAVTSTFPWRVVSHV